MYNFQQYWNSSEKKYVDRWGKDANNFSKPYYGIAKPLEQCRFVMTRLDHDKKPYPVDMRGNAIEIEKYGTTNFGTANQLWIDGHNAFFDGYSLVLPTKPKTVFVNGQPWYVVIGIHEDCITWRDEEIIFSSEFTADRIALNYPLMWITPDRKGICWAGLSATPILGGSTKSKKISSADIIVPITTFLTTANALTEPRGDLLAPLPENANKIIGKWFDGKAVA